MGSCENLIEPHEPMCQADVRHGSCGPELVSCSDVGQDLVECNVVPTGAVNGCLEVARNDNDDCVSMPVDGVCLVLGKVLGDECRVNGACLNEKQSEGVDRSVEANGNAHSVSTSIDGLSGLEAENNSVVCLISGKVLEDECGVSGACLNELQSGSVDLSVDDNGLCAEKMSPCFERNRADDQNSERSLELLRVSGLLSNDAVRDDQKDNVSSNVRGDVGEKSDCLAAVGSDECDQVVSSPSCEVPTNLIIESGSPAHGVEQDKQDSGNSVLQDDQKDDQTVRCFTAEGVVEIMKDKTDYLTGTTTSLQGFENSLEVMPITGSLEKIVGLDEEKDNEPVSSPSGEGFVDVQSDILTRVETLMNCKTLTSLDSEMPSGPVFQQNERDTSARKETVISTQMAPHGSEMPTEFLQIGDQFSSSDLQNDAKSTEGVDCHSAERVPEEIEINRDNERCIKVLPLQACQRTLEGLTMDDSIDNCVQLHEEGDDKHLDHTSLDSLSEILEEKTDGKTNIKVEICTQMFVGENAIDLKDGSSEISFNWSANKLFSPESRQRSVVDENGPSESLHLSRKAVNDGMNTGSAFESSGKTDEVKDHDRINCALETKCPDIVPSSSGRGSQTPKSSRKTQTKRVARKCKNNAGVADLHEVIETIFKVPRSKRNFFSKPGHSSIWGSLGNITKKFVESNGLNLNEIQNGRSQKARVGRRSRKQPNNKNGGSMQKSSGKHCSSSSCIRLKVKVGKEPGQSSLNSMVPEVIDASACTDAVVSDCGTESYLGNSFEIGNFASAVEDRVGEDGTEKQLKCLDNMLETEKIYCDTSVIDVISEKSSGDAAEACVEVPPVRGVEGLESAIEKSYMDSGTSPDSEVINSTPGGQVIGRCPEDFPDNVLTSKHFSASRVATIGKRGKNQHGLPDSENCFLKDRSSGATNIKMKPTKKRGDQLRTDDGINSNEILTSSTIANTSSKSSSSKEFYVEQFPLSGVSREALPAEMGIEDKMHCSLDVEVNFSGSKHSKELLPSMKSKVRQYQRKSGGARKRTFKASDVDRSRRKNDCKQRKNEQKSVNKDKVMEKGVSDHVVNKVDDDLERGNHTVNDIGITDMCNNIASMDMTNLGMAASTAMDRCLPLENAWVRCDDCHKWRRIPVSLVDSIGQTNCQWICKDNLDKAFADCSIPQEKSNAEINAELGISDADEDACDFPLNNKGLESTRPIVSKEYEFTRISTNQFLHRSRKTQTIDEIMVCHCKPHLNGGLGCGEECLNRMLNIECVQGTCPCGDVCSNQQFQKRSYAKMKWDRCGKKGFGLRLQENISKGQFLIEYVGEVLDMHTYEARQKEYASKGHKHFYFMTLDGSEVIDASAKGNLGRFINHSCDPNCRTEKWVVNGEICIGLFALRNIKKGEEVTFDYNYVRVFGAAAKKCYCGSLQCRGYIGGDPTSTEVIDQVDSDEEFPEPVMLEEGCRDGFENTMSKNSVDDVEMQVAESMLKDRDKMDYSGKAVRKLEFAKENDDYTNQSTSIISELGMSLAVDNLKGSLPSSIQPADIALQAEDVASKTTNAFQQDISMENMCKSSSSNQRLETSLIPTLEKSSSDGVKSVITEDKRVFVKSRFLVKTSFQCGSVKKEKVTVNSPIVNKAQISTIKSQLSAKTKKLMEGAPNGRFETVEEKLNELLDKEQGISKRKDAPRGYLKLLLLTAASGASRNGEAIQSNRDLSMILDALLKTKSRVVLTDIINKNGLRMLHNMIKQFRSDFKKIPIVRKLLKVLEYLAIREILTLEHINGGPPVPGMESFRESILSLTEHDDKKVHQIARSFRDRWIPHARYVRRPPYMDRDDGREEFHRGSNCSKALASHNHWNNQGAKPANLLDCAMQAKVGTTGDPAASEGCSATSISGNTKTLKRKSRWDQPAEGYLVPERGKLSNENIGCPHCIQYYSRQDVAHSVDDGKDNILEDIPPGFSSPHNPSMVLSNASSTHNDLFQHNSSSYSNIPVDTVVAHPQRKFNSRLPVSFGIPITIVQQFGSVKTGTESWDSAPGMPFHPFPPLPPLPHHRKETPPSCTASSMAMDESIEGGQRECCDPATCFPDESNLNTAIANQPDTDISGAYNQQVFKRARGSSHDLGRRYFRQQKCFVPPPWVRKRNGWDT